MDAPPDYRSAQLRGLLTDRGPLLLAVVAVLIGLCLLCVFAALLLRDTQAPAADNDDGGGPTPFPSQVGSANDEVIIAGVDGSTSISLTLNIPTSLQVGDKSFSVRPEPLEEDGSWEPEDVEGNTALWVYGTLINYILGLPDNSANRELLENLTPGDTIVLTMRDGTRFTFSVVQREYVAADQADVFSQSTPAVTLILLRARGDDRLVVRGTYVVDTSAGPGNGVSGNVVELGETAQLDDVRLTVTGAASLFNRPEAPPQFVFYMVDFEVQNVGTEPVDLSNLRFFLVDELGNQYATNLQAVQAGGAFPPPSGILLPGETKQATVGYQIPSGLSSPTLTWLVTRAGGTGQIRVTIPFSSSENVSQNALIDLQGAEISADGTTLLLTGQITNLGNESLVVEENDISLLSDGTVHLMLSTNPALPWVVPSGQAQPFALSFQRPGGNDAVLTLFNQPFQLSGLR